MPAKPKIPADEKKFIYDAATKKGVPSDMDRTKLAIEILSYIKKSRLRYGKSWWVVPGEDTIKTMISKARSKYKQSEEKKILGNPEQWAMGIYTDFLPDTKLPKVVRVWQLCQLLGEPFTIRDAEWVARLSELIEDDFVLKQWAKFYANQEFVSQILKKERFDTSEYDKLLIMEPWERVTRIIMGKYELPEDYYQWKNGEIKRIYMLPLALDKSKSYVDRIWLFGKTRKVEMLFFVKGLVWDDMDGEYITLQYDRDEIFSRHEEIESSFTPIWDVNLSSDAIKVYKLWIEELIWGEYVATMTVSERIEILQDLRNWIQSHPLAANDNPEVIDPGEKLLSIRWFLDDEPMERTIERIVEHWNLVPYEIVNRVGLTLED